MPTLLLALMLFQGGHSSTSAGWRVLFQPAHHPAKMIQTDIGPLCFRRRHGWHVSIACGRFDRKVAKQRVIRWRPVACQANYVGGC